MCTTIVINRGEKDITSPRQFKQHFGFQPIADEAYNFTEMDGCLCQIDIENSLNSQNIPFKYDYSDYYVGDLDNVIID